MWWMLERQYILRFFLTIGFLCLCSLSSTTTTTRALLPTSTNNSCCKCIGRFGVYWSHFFFHVVRMLCKWENIKTYISEDEFQVVLSHFQQCLFFCLQLEKDSRYAGRLKSVSHFKKSGSNQSREY